jgi:hypothetical protein
MQLIAKPTELRTEASHTHANALKKWTIEFDISKKVPEALHFKAFNPNQCQKLLCGFETVSDLLTHGKQAIRTLT